MVDSTRAVKRTSLDGHIMGEVTVLQPVTILDLSELGIQVESPTALHTDSLHDFRVPLGDLHVVLKGRVAYCHPGSVETGAVIYKCGVEFIEPPAHALAAIREFLAQQGTSAPRVVEGEVLE
jgi:hypothetical protein